MKRTLKYTYNFFLHAFALAGLILVGGFFAIRFHITDVKGAVDPHSKDFGKMVLGVETQKKDEVETVEKHSVEALDRQIENLAKAKELRIKNVCEIDAIGFYSPVNAKAILEAFETTQSDVIASKMIFAATLRLSEAGRTEEIDACSQDMNSETTADYGTLLRKYSQANGGDNIFSWMNNEQWQIIKTAIAKDKEKIDKAAAIAGIEPRLIVANTIVEQLRLFHSQRELYKKFFEPLKILGNSNKISWGVMGIKEATAIATENNLKDPNSPYYLGPQLENALDFSSGDIADERYKRLTTEGDYYYSYLYGALYLKEMVNQWKNAGYDITYRPEIVGTLFNVGFPQSRPNSDPKVGGSEISVGDAKYSFGSLAYEFYYSGELLDEFPYVIN